jgi:hypothetical protein
VVTFEPLEIFLFIVELNGISDEYESFIRTFGRWKNI